MLSQRTSNSFRQVADLLQQTGSSILCHNKVTKRLSQIKVYLQT